MVREQYVRTTREEGVPEPAPDYLYKVGIYGWRKRCLYLFVLILLAILVINLALTIWIVRVMWFNMEGMGLMQVQPDGVRLEGESDFLYSLYAEEIHSREDSALLLDSTDKVFLHARNENGNVTGRVSVGPEQVQGDVQQLVVSSSSGKMLFQADGKEAVVGNNKLRITGPEGAMFQHSVQTPLIRGEMSKDLKLDAPTRSLSMDAPAGVQIKALSGALSLTSNRDVQLHSTEGLVVLDAEMVRMPNLELGTAGSGGATDLYEVCVCPNSGKLFLSPASVTSTCGTSQQC
ncbi:gamma-sarcoglycan [Engraulis encrasicolus]|uniref:gamma-sarcoglycan n=1 Tax=Engraulis encrasicolus TaxID=184585 RepID=UPI002FCED53B